MSNIGHNNPPDPLDDITSLFSEHIESAEAWLVGEDITTEEQMNSIDVIIAGLKPSKKKLSDGRLAETKPMRDAVDAINKRWNTVADDIGLMIDKLVKLAAPVRKRVADEKAEVKRLAYEAAQKAERDAEAARKAAENTSDIDVARDAEQAMIAAKDASNAASAANRDKVKGFRKVQKYEIENMGAVVNYIAKFDKEAMAEFAAEYVRKNHKAKTIAGVKQWEEKEPY